MKKPGKKSLTPAWLQLLAIGCWSVCNAGCDPAQHISCQKPVIMGSASYSLTNEQKELLAADLTGRLQATPHLTFCHAKDCQEAAKMTMTVYQIDAAGTLACQLALQNGSLQLKADNTSPKDLAELTGGCADKLAVLLQLHYASTQKLLAAIADNKQTGQELISILDELILRKDPQVIQPLGQLLSTTDNIEIFTKTLGVLVATDNPEAAKIIIKSNRHKSPQAAIQMIYALEQIPCKETFNYLETMADGHPDRKVREAAAIVLQNKQRFSTAQGL